MKERKISSEAMNKYHHTPCSHDVDHLFLFTKKNWSYPRATSNIFSSLWLVKAYYADVIWRKNQRWTQNKKYSGSLELISNVPHIIRYNLKYLHDNQVQIRYTSQRCIYLTHEVSNCYHSWFCRYLMFCKWGGFPLGIIGLAVGQISNFSLKDLAQIYDLNFRLSQ